MATLEEIRVHPIKSLDAVSVDAAEIVENGGLELDRRYAIVDENGHYVNGKREQRIHRLRTNYALGSNAVTLREGEEFPDRTFYLEDDRDELESWLGDYLGYAVELVRDDAGGMPDDTEASGPTVIATGTLEAVASWYDGIDAEEMCRRLRPNLVVDGPAFWEDRLYDRPGRVVPFSIGEARFHGVNPCQRCVVPTRDPDTGDPTPGFRETFLRRRKEAVLEADTASERRSDPSGDTWFDHYFRLMVNTRVPLETWGTALHVGDELAVSESIPETNR
ncbi:MAG: MOSC domain-containing protein [Halobacteriota archaeon]